MVLTVFALFISSLAANARVNPGPWCSSNVATTTTYFLPHIKDYCPGQTSPCASFKREVRMQGTGVIGGGKVLHYTGKTENMGDCETARGAAGKCLIPFVSVAADRRYYRMGDIIKMPQMKGREITLPNGKTMIHPGYFIVHDTGGAIKGQNRFDFFSGTSRPEAANNAFGYKGMKDLQIASKGQCTRNKEFSVVRRSSPEFQVAEANIQDAVNGSRSTRTQYASVNKGGIL